MKYFPTLWKQNSAAPLSKDLEKVFSDFNSVWLDVDRAFEAFDRSFPVGIRNVTFPPCDVVKTDSGYSVTLAVAGFAKDELTVDLDSDNVLTVTGKKEAKSTEKYLVKGIATRQFVRKWQLAAEDEVVDVKLANGLLSIDIKRNEPLPQEETVKRLEIKAE